VSFNMNALVGPANVLFATLDCLRFDVARTALARGLTPHLTAVLPPGGWEARETPGTFTLPAHQAFFHGFLPTPLGTDRHERLFALEFEGSLTVGPGTCVFSGGPSVPSGFVQRGYRTFCVGGVGFFNKRNPLGNVLPGYFEESIWSPELGVAGRDSARCQVDAALAFLASVPIARRVLLFINFAATHPPHAFYLPGATADSPASQAAALASIDRELPRLFAELRQRGPCFCLLMGDHGEAYGEDGRWGHRIAHPVVTTVPYAEFLL
jgi:hypothetical protein